MCWHWFVRVLGLALGAAFDFGELLLIQTWFGCPTAVPSFLCEDFDVTLTYPVFRAYHSGGMRAEAVFAKPGHRTGSLLNLLTPNARVKCTNCASRVVLRAD